MPAKKNQAKKAKKDLPAAPAAASPDEILELLEARAATNLAPYAEERRLFLRFDAWCDPGVRGWLLKNKGKLSKTARALFAADLPKVDFDALLLGYELLRDVPIDRARMLVNGVDYGVETRLSGRQRDKLVAKKLTFPGVIRQLAALQHEIFERHFPSPPTQPGEALERAARRFSIGTLRVTPRGGAKHESRLNAEPDTAYFFLFGEFALQAALHAAPPTRAWWQQFASLLIALQDLYVVRYQIPGGKRSFNHYGDHWYKGARPNDEELTRRLVESVRARDTTLEHLAERASWNAAWAFYDDVA